jgi:hypothetical protein
MEEEKQEEKLEPEAGDVAHTITEALISAVPYVGGPAAELFSFLIVPPLQRRRDEWLKSIADGLRELQEKVEGFNMDNLQDNQMFVTTVMHASQAAIRNHQKEKLEALRNAVLNAALPNPPEEDLQLMFLDFIDTLTPWHLRVLKFFDDPRGWARAHGIIYPIWPAGSQAHVLEHAFPKLKGQRGFYDQMVKDLHSRGLFSVDSLHGLISADGMLAPRTTEMGKIFLRFITSPIEAAE